jgi:hypothetical protein
MPPVLQRGSITRGRRKPGHIARPRKPDEQVQSHSSYQEPTITPSSVAEIAGEATIVALPTRQRRPASSEAEPAALPLMARRRERTSGMRYERAARDEQRQTPNPLPERNAGVKGGVSTEEADDGHVVRAVRLTVYGLPEAESASPPSA